MIGPLHRWRARRRRRALRPCPPLQPIRRWWVDARILRQQEAAAVLTLEELRDRRYGGPVVDPYPPQAITGNEQQNEIEITWPVWASSEEHALRANRRRLERAGVHVLAIRARRI